MIPATVTFYGVVTAIHVLAVVLAFGVTFSYPVAISWLKRHHPEFMPTFHTLQDRFGQRLIVPSMVVILASGIYLATDADVWSEAWVTIPFVILIVLFGMGGAFFSRRERAIAETARRDLRDGGTLSREYERQLVTLNRGGLVGGLLIAVAVFVMVAKPF